jgi:hypothetical protein
MNRPLNVCSYVWPDRAELGADSDFTDLGIADVIRFSPESLVSRQSPAIVVFMCYCKVFLKDIF